jgi:transposase
MTDFHRHDVTDDQWTRLAPLLPPQRRAGRGRPAHDHRTILNGILWRLKTGVPWRDLPDRFGPWPTVYSRFRRWQKAGVWDRVLAALQAEGDAAGNLDWTLHHVDGTMIRAHGHAAGARKKGAPIKPWAAVTGDSRPGSTSGSRAAASR